MGLTVPSPIVPLIKPRLPTENGINILSEALYIFFSSARSRWSTSQ